MLPSPILSFTLPSIHDDTVLACRIYHPECLTSADPSLSGQRRHASSADIASGAWIKRAAVVAHPYAPMGGCYDDPVVNVVAATILKQGFVVGTFNFRGAGASHGRTSWTSKAEQADYASFVGFLAVYLNSLNIPVAHACRGSFAASHVSDDGSKSLQVPSPTASYTFPDSPNVPDSLQMSDPACPTPPTYFDPIPAANYTDPDDEDASRRLPPLILLAGYSYGSLVTLSLPPLKVVLKNFQSPTPGSAAFEIHLRAERLASQQNTIIGSLFRSQQSLRSPTSRPMSASSPGKEPSRGRSIQTNGAGFERRKASNMSARSIRVGGEETSSSVRRASHDFHGQERRSVSVDGPRQRIRRSLDLVSNKVRAKSSEKDRLFSGQSQHDSQPSASGDIETREASPAGSIKGKENSAGDSGEEKKHRVSLPIFREAYMLVSPLQGMVANLAAMSFLSTPARAILPSSDPHPKSSLGFQEPRDQANRHHKLHRPQKRSKIVDNKAIETIGEEDLKLVINPTLAIFGDEDVFSSKKRLCTWVAKLEASQMSVLGGPNFRHVEVEGAGHFWHDRQSLNILRQSVEAFVAEL